MATLIPPVKVFPSGAGHLSQYVIGHCASQGGTATKVHIKTNIPKASIGPMVMIEAVGFCYGAAQAIRSSWCFYVYLNALYSVNVANVYPGLTAEAVYYSTDNFVCLRAAVSSEYFTGFVLNAFVNAGDGPGTPVLMTAHAWNTNAGNFY